MTLPPIPSWYGLHPLVIHFPIALLLVAPVLVVVALLVRERTKPCTAAALLVMALGTAGSYLAGASGEAAGQVAIRTPEITRVIGEHEAMAQKVQLVFTILTLCYAALLFVPALRKREMSRGAALAANAAFLVVYLGACLLLAGTAHLGGRLVHEFGVLSMIGK